MKTRLLFVVRVYLLLLMLFVSQKVVFMLVNMGHSEGAPFGECAAVLLHGLRLDSVAACYLVALPVLVLVTSCFFKRFALRRVLRPWWWISAILITLTFVADMVLYFFWGAKMDANDLMYASKPKEMLASVSWWTIPIGLAIIIALAFLYYLCLCRVTPERLDVPKNKWNSLLFIPLLALLFLGMRGGVSQSTANPSYAYFSKYPFCNHSALNPLFNIIHSLFKSDDLENTFHFIDAEEASALVEPCFSTDNTVTDTILNAQRPDILFIVWEGGGWDMVMNESVGPNITRIASDGILFSNCYANNFRTDRGLVSLLNGWLGLPTTSLMKMPDKCRKLPALASVLQEHGYATRFVYGGDIDFTNMRLYLSETGFQTVMGSESFRSARKLSNWGAPDAYTLTTSCIEPGHPSFTVLLTLSSHEPWEVPVRMLENNRMNSFAYADSCIGVLVDSLRNSPAWDNLLIVIVPDHGVPLSASQSTSDPAVSHIPMVWTGGAVRGHRVIDVMMSQSDLVATLLSQMGLSSDSFPFSRNVLSPHYSEEFHFALHSFKNGCNFINEDGIISYDCVAKKITAVHGEMPESKTRFLEALLQYLYHTTSRL